MGYHDLDINIEAGLFKSYRGKADLLLLESTSDPNRKAVIAVRKSNPREPTHKKWMTAICRNSEPSL